MYENRVKGLDYQNDHLASIASNGDVTVWTIDIDEQDITELCTTNIGCRPICLTIIDLNKFANEYVLKRENSDDDVTVQTVARAASANTSNKMGKVVIEIEDNENNEDAKKPKSRNQTVFFYYTYTVHAMFQFCFSGKIVRNNHLNLNCFNFSRKD